MSSFYIKKKKKKKEKEKEKVEFACSLNFYDTFMRLVF